MFASSNQGKKSQSESAGLPPDEELKAPVWQRKASDVPMNEGVASLLGALTRTTKQF